jgi:hypothetical protein
MILYRKQCGGFCLLGRLSGSIVRALLPALISASFAVALETWAKPLLGSDLNEHFIHPYPYQIFTLIFGFLLVFRTNFAYHRFWNASTFITTMHSKWADAALSLLAFSGEGYPNDARRRARTTCNDLDAARAADQLELRLRLVHLFSLLSACAMAQLRFDMELRNLDPDLDVHEDDPDGARERGEDDDVERQQPRPQTNIRVDLEDHIARKKKGDGDGDGAASGGTFGQPRGASVTDRARPTNNARPGLGRREPSILKHAAPRRPRGRAPMRERACSASGGDPLAPLGMIEQLLLVPHKITMHSDYQTMKEYHRRNPLIVIGGVRSSEREVLQSVPDRAFIVKQWIVEAVTTAEQNGQLHAAAPVISRV